MTVGRKFVLNSGSAYDSSAAAFIGQACVLNWVYGFNPTATDVFLQLHNSLSLSAGRTAEVSIKLGGGQSFSWAPALDGMRFTAGVSWITSSTGPTLTVSGVAIWLAMMGRDLQ